MKSLSVDNERLRLEQERIIKSILGRQNQRNTNPSLEDGNIGEMYRQGEDNVEVERGRIDNEEESENSSRGKGNKRPHI